CTLFGDVRSGSNRRGGRLLGCSDRPRDNPATGATGRPPGARSLARHKRHGNKGQAARYECFFEQRLPPDPQESRYLWIISQIKLNNTGADSSKSQCSVYFKTVHDLLFIPPFPTVIEPHASRFLPIWHSPGTE